jgi:predicted FMN-binding regulatory protein PaiB
VSFCALPHSTMVLDYAYVDVYAKMYVFLDDDEELVFDVDVDLSSKSRHNSVRHPWQRHYIPVQFTRSLLHLMKSTSHTSLLL